MTHILAKVTKLTNWLQYISYSYFRTGNDPFYWINTFTK